MFETFDATWRQPDSVTCFLEVPDARVQALTAHLSTLNLHGPLAALGSLHAFRAFVIPATADVPARLVVNTVFDGELDAFHVELVEHAGAELLELLSHCAYPPHSKADIAHWLTSRSTRP